MGQKMLNVENFRIKKDLMEYQTKYDFGIPSNPYYLLNSNSDSDISNLKIIQNVQRSFIRKSSKDEELEFNKLLNNSSKSFLVCISFKQNILTNHLYMYILNQTKKNYIDLFLQLTTMFRVIQKKGVSQYNETYNFSYDDKTEQVRYTNSKNSILYFSFDMDSKFMTYDLYPKSQVKKEEDDNKIQPWNLQLLIGNIQQFLMESYLVKLDFDDSQQKSLNIFLNKNLMRSWSMQFLGLLYILFNSWLLTFIKPSITIVYDTYEINTINIKKGNLTMLDHEIHFWNDFLYKLYQKYRDMSHAISRMFLKKPFMMNPLYLGIVNGQSCPLNKDSLSHSSTKSLTRFLLSSFRPCNKPCRYKKKLKWNKLDLHLWATKLNNLFVHNIHKTFFKQFAYSFFCSFYFLFFFKKLSFFFNILRLDVQSSELNILVNYPTNLNRLKTMKQISHFTFIKILPTNDSFSVFHKKIENQINIYKPLFLIYRNKMVIFFDETLNIRNAIYFKWLNKIGYNFEMNLNKTNDSFKLDYFCIRRRRSTKDYLSNRLFNRNCSVNFNNRKVFKSIIQDLSPQFKIEIRIHAFKRHLTVIKFLIQKLGSQSQFLLIQKLTPIIQQWCFSVNISSNKNIFYYCDSVLFLYLWKWACHRHQNKSKSWIREKYFHRIYGKNWVFSVKIDNHYICLPFYRQTLLTSIINSE